MLSREPATGWSRIVGWVVLLCVVVMTIATFSALDQGYGPAPTPHQRQTARVTILVAGAVAIASAVIAWWRSRRPSHESPISQPISNVR